MSTTERTTPQLLRSTFAPGDVTYLLREVTPTFVTLEEKERLIQSGERHYGHLLSPEGPPRAEYRALFERTLAGGAPELAAQVLRLARVLHREVRDVRGERGRIAVVSLARGGTPVGALVTRALRARLGEDAAHYGVSVVRDHGVDFAALDLLRAGHEDYAVVFVDGWTGKGVISREVRRSLERYRHARGARIPGDLHVLSDPAGSAASCATRADVLVPNAMLGATVAGLVSRTVLPDRPGELHGAAFLEHLAPHDVTRHFLDTVGAHLTGADDADLPEPSPAKDAAARARAFLEDAQVRYGPRPVNHVKPGLGEATRVLLRRAPQLLLVRDEHAPGTRHLLDLARERGVEITVRTDMPYEACALIKSLDLDP